MSFFELSVYIATLQSDSYQLGFQNALFHLLCLLRQISVTMDIFSTAEFLIAEK